MKSIKKRMMARSGERIRRVLRGDVVLRLLEDDRYPFRTAEGIAKTLGAEAIDVRKILQSQADDVVRLSRRATDGRELYTTRKRYYQNASLADRLRCALMNRVY